MGWEQTIDEPRRTRWERSDGYATITIRASAGGDWVVWIDRLQQAPDGPGYDHHVLDTEAAAREQATTWRTTYDTDG